MYKAIKTPALALAAVFAFAAGLAVMQGGPASAASDTKSPVTKITSPTKGASITAALVSYSIKGTSKDNIGGSGVEYVEVSTDGGINWGRAADRSGTGTWSTWSYRWPLDFSGMYILKARAKDKAGNMANPTQGIKVTVTR